MIGKLILAAILLSPNAASASIDCDEHPIYCQIVNNRPTIEKTYALKLSNVIFKKSLKYNLNPAILTAIFAQESMYKLDAKNCATGYLRYQTKTLYQIKKVCTDFGIGQIHYKTVERYELDVDRLLVDMDYSVDAAANVLSDFKKRYKRREDNWWTRYNSGSDSARNKYQQLVERFISAN